MLPYLVGLAFAGIALVFGSCSARLARQDEGLTFWGSRGPASYGTFRPQTLAAEYDGPIGNLEIEDAAAIQIVVEGIWAVQFHLTERSRDAIVGWLAAKPGRVIMIVWNGRPLHSVGALSRALEVRLIHSSLQTFSSRPEAEHLRDTILRAAKVK